MVNSNELKELLKTRRSVFPNMYNDKPIEKEVLVEILENANWAPTHAKTEPWRFKVFQGVALQQLSDYMGSWYEQNIPTEKYSKIKHKKVVNRPLQSQCVIAICMERDEKERIPEWEEVAAVACAVQNMWLTCTTKGIGSYWSSPRAITQDAGDFLKLKEGERCLGLFYMGYYDTSIPLKGERTPIEDKVEWV